MNNVRDTQLKDMLNHPVKPVNSLLLGPGLTNLVTPIQDAYTDGDPLVVLFCSSCNICIRNWCFSGSTFG